MITGDRPSSPAEYDTRIAHSLRFRDTGNGVLYACSCDDWEEVANDDADAARVYRVHGEHIAGAVAGQPDTSVCECGCDETDHGFATGCIHCQCRAYAPRACADIDTRIQAAENAPHAPEALVERMARAMWAADCGHSVEELSGATPEPYVRLAAAALRVVTEPADGGAK